MKDIKRIFITGCNRGLGKELAQYLALKHPAMEIHVSSRNSPQQLQQQFNNKAIKQKVRCYQMDINQTDSLKKVADTLKSQQILFDYIVANAAVGLDWGFNMPSVDVASSTLKTNVDSTIDFIKLFLPLLSINGRVVVVSSLMGTLDAQSNQLKKLLTNPKITEKQILTLSDCYIKAASNKNMGFFHFSAYRTSKALINAWSRFILPTYLKQTQSCIAMHPGWCSTDLGGQNATLTPLQGAIRIYDCLWLKEIQPDRFYNQKFCSYESCQ